MKDQVAEVNIKIRERDGIGIIYRPNDRKNENFELSKLVSESYSAFLRRPGEIRRAVVHTPNLTNFANELASKYPIKITGFNTFRDRSVFEWFYGEADILQSLLRYLKKL